MGRGSVGSVDITSSPLLLKIRSKADTYIFGL